MRNKNISKTFLSVMVVSSIMTSFKVLDVSADDNNQSNSSSVDVSNTSNVSVISSELNSQNFFDKLGPLAQKIANKNDLYPSLLLAQAAIESAYGQSSLTQNSNNLFGIKATNGQGINTQTNEFSNGNSYTTNSTFSTYPDLLSSLQGYADFLNNNSRYLNVHRSMSPSVEQAAINIQADGYATDPAYSNKLISFINQNNLKAYDSGTMPSNNSQNDQNTQNNNDNSTQNNNAIPSQPKKENITKYVGADGKETFKLSNKYRTYKLYNHVKGTTRNIKSYGWNKSLNSRKKVFVDCLGIRNYGQNESKWYRIRLSEHSKKKYWVYSKALDIPKVNYIKENKEVTVNTNTDDGVYNHVYNSPYLSKKVKDNKNLVDDKYHTSLKAVIDNDGIRTEWYRIYIPGTGNAWIKSKDLSNITKHKEVKNNYNNKSGYAYLNNYGKYHLYNDIPGSSKKAKITNWDNVKVPNDYLITYDKSGVKGKDSTNWYRINLNNKNYWIASGALKF
ncbi:glycoside hydrolase family 73 protein [Apilactobacillus quenuiae]|uniref:glycoside hydrolase family 73 protein n=1 Tax=Apilactobacillus quenuiae TaxID=2008377 RepID=UPI000D02002B|nr:glucosaminidase domain-containing protein [Apilactobacillus quenuiae]